LGQPEGMDPAQPRPQALEMPTFSTGQAIVISQTVYADPSPGDPALAIDHF